jgi:putative nucleotidyltransferase with HDIG domain
MLEHVFYRRQRAPWRLGNEYPRVLKEADVLRAFPAIEDIRDAGLRKLSTEMWRYVSERNPAWTDIERIPLHPTMPIAVHGNLVKHVVAMVRISEALVPIYRELWKQDLDLDTFRAASYVHDAAKVIEFTDKDGAVTGIPGYNHAIEAARIVRELGGPEPLAHVVEAHSFAGALVVPRTRDAQLFLMLDPMCLNVFPEQGAGVVGRHLKANGWDDPGTLERYKPPR